MGSNPEIDGIYDGPGFSVGMSLTEPNALVAAVYLRGRDVGLHFAMQMIEERTWEGNMP